MDFWNKFKRKKEVEMKYVCKEYCPYKDIKMRQFAKANVYRNMLSGELYGYCFKCHDAGCFIKVKEVKK